jgi:putative DNA primase/helicase
MTLQEVKNSADIVDVVGKYVTLKKQGAEFVGLCPFHNDTNPSMAVVPRKQAYFCPVCDSHGDVLDFVSKAESVNVLEAAEIISGGNFKPPKREQVDKKPEWEWVGLRFKNTPPPPDGMNGKTLEGRWRYSDTFYVYRFSDESGRKQIRPATFCRNDKGKTSWKWQGLSDDRPLYNLERILSEPDAQVIVVEGEKTADALQSKFRKLIVTTWHGGIANVQKTDWSLLKGRVNYVWPDNDAVGWCAAEAVRVLAESPDARLILAPDDAPKGWDFADVEWTAKQAAEWIKSRNIDGKTPEKCPAWLNGETAIKYELFGKTAWVSFGDQVKVREQPEHVSEVIKVNDAPAPEAIIERPEQPDAPDDMPFKFLGYMKQMDGVVFYFYAVESRVVTSFSQSKFTTNGLLTLADADFWEARYPTKHGFDVTRATDWLMRVSYRTGIFDIEKIRGRGAWIDGGRVVIHRGNSLVVDGDTRKVHDFTSRYIYEISQKMDISTGDQLTDDHGARFLDTLEKINWERPVNAMLLAGWCVIAPVCGALDWRPHIWITGGAGTGKSWIMREVVQRLLDSIALIVEGETTEAGIRQHLGNDALPVIFEEAEAEDKQSLDRIEKLLNLMRIASTESGAKVLKGSSSHVGKSFNIRSCFLFLSIIYQARKQADLTRVTVLGLRSPRNFTADKFDDLKSSLIALFDQDFPARFHSRTMNNLHTLQQNIKVFSRVAADQLKSQRLADQLAPLCAGAFLLKSTSVVSEKSAREWFAAQDWSLEMGLTETRDELQCLSFILEQVVTVEMGEYNSKVDRTIGELLAICCEGGYSTGDRDAAESRLRRMGIRVDGVFYTISNTSKNIMRMLTGTQWEKNHAKVLQRIEGSETTGAVHFSPGHVSRGVKLRWLRTPEKTDIPVIYEDDEHEADPF